ncbi:MAG: biopolymer transporter ExbD [Novosphingobium sp.]|nr:biopolymer transporter ExbD [Novosphingobium sp.]
MAVSLGSAGGRRRGRRGRAPMSEINVTPFVDVMLVLLVVFMVTAPLLTAGVPVELPDSRAKALSEEAKQIDITIRRDGAVFIDNSPLAPGELTTRLERIAPSREGKLPLVVLRADKALDYGRVIGVMGELNRAGFNSISLVTGVTVKVPGSETPLIRRSDEQQ